MTITLDDELRETLDHAMKTLETIQARRPFPQNLDPAAKMTQLVRECKAGLQKAIDNAAVIR